MCYPSKIKEPITVIFQKESDRYHRKQKAPENILNYFAEQMIR